MQGEKFADFLDRFQCAFCIYRGRLLSGISVLNRKLIQKHKQISDQFDFRNLARQEVFQFDEIVCFGKRQVPKGQSCFQIFFRRLLGMKTNEVRNRFASFSGKKYRPFKILLRLFDPSDDVRSFFHKELSRWIVPLGGRDRNPPTTPSPVWAF